MHKQNVIYNMWNLSIKINEIDYSLKSLEDKLYLQTKDKITISETLNNYNLELSNLKEKLSNTSIDIKSLEALEKMADGHSTKIIIPSELQGLAGTLAGLSEVIDQK